MSVYWLVGLSHHVFELRAVLALLPLPNRPRLGCCVSGLVKFQVEGETEKFWNQFCWCLLLLFFQLIWNVLANRVIPLKKVSDISILVGISKLKTCWLESPPMYTLFLKNLGPRAGIPAVRLNYHSWHKNKITPVSKHKSSAPLGPLPHSPSHQSSTNIGGRRYRWLSDAFVTSSASFAAT